MKLYDAIAEPIIVSAARSRLPVVPVVLVALVVVAVVLLLVRLRKKK